MAKEEWRAVVGFEGLYEVSSLGRVKRLPIPRYCGGGRYAKMKENIRPGYVDSQGYYSVNLGKQKKTTVHRLVCEAFHGPPPPDKAWVAHFDGDKLNNRADNLRWASPQENAEDGIRLLERSQGERHWKARLTEEDVLAIRADYERIRGQKGQYNRLAVKWGVDRYHIKRIVTRQLWYHI